jgi:hypothetical protein
MGGDFTEVLALAENLWKQGDLPTMKNTTKTASENLTIQIMAATCSLLATCWDRMRKSQNGVGILYVFIRIGAEPKLILTLNKSLIDCSSASCDRLRIIEGALGTVLPYESGKQSTSNQTKPTCQCHQFPRPLSTPFLPISDPFNGALKRLTQKANS